MIYSHAYLDELLTRALGQLDVPGDCAAVLEGSIAAGFGNDTSDIDFLLIDQSGREHVTMPTILFIDGRRVEIRLRSVRQVERQLDDVLRQGKEGSARLAGISADLLNRCQRFANAFPLRNHALVERLRSPLSDGELSRIVSGWFRHRARRSARYAMALSVLGLRRESGRWARTALIQAAKSWVASRGETYLETKWISQQLERVRGAGPFTARLDVLLAVDQDEPPARFLEQCLALVADLGVGECPYQPGWVQVAGRRTVTTWQIGQRVHVIRDKRDVFVLASDAAEIWRSIVFGVSLPDLLLRLPPRLRGISGPLLLELLQVGLLRLRWRGGATIAGWTPMCPTPSGARPMLSLQGAFLEAEQKSGAAGTEQAMIELLPLPAGRFTASGMSLVWANVMAENAREDLVGAVARGQWGTAAATAHRMLRQACLAVLSSYGVNPLPPAEEAVPRLRQMPGLSAELAESAARLERSIRPDGTASAQRLLGELDSLLRALRDVTGASVFPASFESADGWRDTLELGYDWIRIGGYLDASLPIDEARDLVASGGRQPIQRAAPASGHAQAGDSDVRVL